MIDEKLRSCACLENADHRDFGSTLKGMRSKKSIEINQFPKTIAKERRVLSNHKKNEEKSGHIVHVEVDKINWRM